MKNLRANHPLVLGTLFFSAFLSLQTVQAVPITGTVFEDRSENGLRDPEEKGIAKVAISNGREVVLTDSTGNYKIDAAENGFVFIIKPAGWKLRLNSENRPDFFRKIPENKTIDFALYRAEEPDVFKVLVTADPQVDTEKEIGFYLKSIVEPFSQKKDLAFGVTLGDIVNDRFELFQKMAQATGQIGIPWYDINGNHDVDLSVSPREAVSKYESVYGPGTYAFEYAQVLFIALDDIRLTKLSGYIGGLDDHQFHFLESLLKVTGPGKRVVLMLHIPLFQNGSFGKETFRRADRDRLFKLLGSRQNVLVLSGHTHSQCHVFHGTEDGWPGKEPLHEYNVAAACGSFWGGKPDADGVPVATMWDGTPPGAAILTFGGSDSIQTDYLPSGKDPGFQIGLLAPAAAKAGESWVSFYANVFNGHDAWKVDFKVGKQDWQPMRRVPSPDPSYFKAFLEQNTATPPVPWKRLPDPVECRHLWRAYLPTNLPSGTQHLTVRATEPSGKEYLAEIDIFLAEK